MRSKSDSVMLIVMMLSMSFILVPAMPALADGPPSTIMIQGNDDLSDRALTYGWSGDGSASHPYVIANLAIDGGQSPGILIRNTDSPRHHRELHVHRYAVLHRYDRFM